VAREAILMIEDDPAMVRGLKDNFEARGFRVETAYDGEAGLEAAMNSSQDLILLDIMLTAKGQEDDIILGLNLGADDYVTKPFSIRELLARVGALLRRRQANGQEVFRFGDCELDLASRRLFRKGVQVTLTAREFHMLEYFARRQGRALTRDAILDSVWGNAVFVTSRSVDRCIATLRAKIEPDPHHPTYIQTIREIGYRFELPDPAPRSTPHNPRSSL
jgi:DNA-binding response OmpR family regulator